MIRKYTTAITACLDDYGRNMRDSTRAQVRAVKIAAWAWAIVRLVLIVGLAFIILYPLIHMTSIALRHRTELFDPTVIWIPRTITLENFTLAIERMDYFSAFRTTVSISIVSSILLVISCGLAGYGLARFDFAGKKVLFGILLLTIILPPQLFLIPQFLDNSFFDFFGIVPLVNIFGANVPTINILNTGWPLYLPAALGQGLRSGLLIYIFRQFFRGMPSELEDAAYVDGAGTLVTFVKVILPNAVPAILTVFLFSLVWYWNDTVYSNMFLGSNSTITMRLANHHAFSVVDPITNVRDMAAGITSRFAGSILSITPILVVYIIFQRHFVESIEKTGIVG